MSPESIKTVAHLLAGHEAGWQSRFAALLGISRGYAHNLLTGQRTLSQSVFIKMVIAGRERSALYRQRAAEIEAILETPTLEEVSKLPISDEEYERQTDEAEAIIEDLAFGAAKKQEE